MSKLDAIVNSLGVKEEVLNSGEYIQVRAKIKNLNPEILEHCRLERIIWSNDCLQVEYLGEINGFNHNDLRRMKIPLEERLENVIWVTEDYDIDGIFCGYEVNLRKEKFYFKSSKDLLGFINENPDHHLLQYSSDCGEEAINLISRPEEDFTEG